MEPLATLAPLDVAIVAGYVGAIVAVTAAVSLARCRGARAAAKRGAGRLADGGGDGDDEAHAFFLAHEAVPWWAVAMS